MVPQSKPRKPRNSSKVNLLISVVFHAVLILTAFYFAARGGLLGKQLKTIAAELVKEKPKPPEKPAEQPKPAETPKVEQARQTPKPAPTKVAEAPRPPATADVAPAVAPAAAALPAFDFAGGKAVETSSNPVEIYRGLLESAFRAKWNPPEDLADDNYVTEVQVAIGADGSVNGQQLVKGSGNTRWDDSVRQAVAAVAMMDRPPPARFPSHVVVRFDMPEQVQPMAIQ